MRIIKKHKEHEENHTIGVPGHMRIIKKCKGNHTICSMVDVDVTRCPWATTPNG
jgi:hypothetical protein